MKFDKLNTIIVLLCVLVVGLLVQNRKLNHRLSEIESKVEDAIEYAENASEYAQQASENSFGNVCSECPEDLRRY